MLWNWQSSSTVRGAAPGQRVLPACLWGGVGMGHIGVAASVLVDGRTVLPGRGSSGEVAAGRRGSDGLDKGRDRGALGRGRGPDRAARSIRQVGDRRGI